MVWKREAEMRLLDSIREIKDNLQRLEDRLSCSRHSRRSRHLCRMICTMKFADRCCGLQTLLLREDLAEAEAGAEIRSAGFAVNRRGKKLRRQKRSSRRSGRSRNLCNRQQKCR